MTPQDGPDWERLLREIESYEDPRGCAGVLWRLACRLPWRLVEREPLAGLLGLLLGGDE